MLACFHVSIGPQDERSAIAPGTKPVRRKPIQPDVAETVVPTQHHVAEILEMVVIRMPNACDLRSDHSACVDFARHISIWRKSESHLPSESGPGSRLCRSRM